MFLKNFLFYIVGKRLFEVLKRKNTTLTVRITHLHAYSNCFYINEEPFLVNFCIALIFIYLHSFNLIFGVGL